MSSLPALPLFDERTGPGPQLLRLAGTFWETYAGKRAAEDLLDCVAAAEQQLLLDQQEAHACGSHTSVPVYHRERWRCLSVRESTLLNRVARLGEGATLGDGLRLGIPRVGAPLVLDLTFEHKASIVPLITSDLTRGGALWFCGQDFFFDRKRQQLQFVTNPFENSWFEIRPVYEAGVQIDRELDLWLHQADWERGYVPDHYGYLFGIEGDSTPAMKRLVTAAYRSLVGGSSDGTIMDAIAACADVPLAAGGETVEGIYEYEDRRVVVTDQNVYTFTQLDTLTVAVGDALERGQTMSTCVQRYDLLAGETPVEMLAATISADHLGMNYFDSLAFVDKDVELVQTVVDGKTHIEFELSGFEPDRQRFWATVHSRERSSGSYIADGLAKPLAATINPLKFLVEHVLRYNTILVRVSVTARGRDADLEQLRILRKLTPPWHNVMLVLVAESKESGGTIDVEDSGDEPAYSPPVVTEDANLTLTEKSVIGYTAFTCR